MKGNTMRLRTRAALTGIAVATTAALLVSAPNAMSAATTKSFAYGVSVNGQGKQPYVESTDGSTHTQGGSIPDNPLLTGDIALLSAGDDTATVKVANLVAGKALTQLPPELTSQLDQLKAACEQLVDPATSQIPDILGQLPIGGVTQPTKDQLVGFCNDLLDGKIPNLAAVKALQVNCQGDAGTVTVAGVSVLGAEVPLAGQMAPNTKLFTADNPLSQGVQVTFNRQTPHKDGSFTVDGVVVDLGGNQGEIVLASTTCGIPVKTPAGRAPTPPRAPAPQPVERDVPVTG